MILSTSTGGVSQGVLESYIPDIFGLPYMVATTWDDALYTLDGSNWLQSLTNPANDQWTTVPILGPGGLSPMGVVKDVADDTRWFEDQGDAWANFTTFSNNSTLQDLVELDTEGVIMITSMRTMAVHGSGLNVDLKCMGSGGSVPSGSILWPTLQGTTSPRQDWDMYLQSTTGHLYDPAGDLVGSQWGPIKGNLGSGGDLVPASYNRATNVLTGSCYGIGVDVVVVHFYQSSGYRLMINGQFIDVEVVSCHNNDGSYKAAPFDAAGEAAFLAQDFSPYQMTINAGDTPGATTGANLSLMFLSTSKFDYQAILPGGTSDGVVQQISSILLGQKPVWP